MPPFHSCRRPLTPDKRSTKAMLHHKSGIAQFIAELCHNAASSTAVPYHIRPYIVRGTVAALVTWRINRMDPPTLQPASIQCTAQHPALIPIPCVQRDSVFNMKLALQSLALLMTAAVTIPSVIADFHIIQGVAPGGGTGLVACPSNYYNCNCMENGDRAAEVIVNGRGVGGLPDNVFSVKAGLCGMGQLNFYKQSNGAWNFYVDGGDGSLQGTCYSNSAGSSCSGGFLFYDQLVCYSYICGS